MFVPGKQYRVAVYGCNRGFMLSGRTSDSMFCQEYGWTGLEPECERTDHNQVEEEQEEWEEEEGGDLCETEAGCEQECRVEAGAPVCYCSPGFEMVGGAVPGCGRVPGGQRGLRRGVRQQVTTT